MDLRVKSCDGAAAAVAISVCNLVPPGTLKETIQLVRDVPSELSANAAVRSAHVQTSGGASGVYAALHIYADTNCAAQDAMRNWYDKPSRQATDQVEEKSLQGVKDGEKTHEGGCSDKEPGSKTDQRHASKSRIKQAMPLQPYTSNPSAKWNQEEEVLSNSRQTLPKRSRKTQARSSPPLHETLDEDSYVTDPQIFEVAKATSYQWFEIGTNLGFRYADLAGHMGSKDPLHIKLVHVIAGWKASVDSPTVGILLDACRKAGVRGDARRALVKFV